MISLSHKPVLKTIFATIILIWNLSCSGSVDTDQINLVFYGDPKSIDPALATDVRSGQLCAFIYDNLVRYGHTGDLQPALAESWQIDSAGTVYIFHLRRGVRFTSGAEFTASQVKSSFERIMSSDTPSHRKWLFKKVMGAEPFSRGVLPDIPGFTARDDSTFTIRLTEPFSPFLGFLAMPAASIVSINREGRISGTGPWILTDWIHDGHLKFTRNDDYFAGKPRSGSLKIRILPEALPRAAEFITGYLDIMEIPEAEFTLWIDDPQWAPYINIQNELNTYYIGLNCSRKPFSDVRVRQAVNFAVDVDTIIRTINNGKGTAAAGPIPPSLIPGDTLQPYGYDPEKAIKLLKESGYENGFDVELWQGASGDLMRITETIQAQLARVGIRVSIVQNDWNMYSQAVTEGKPDMYYRSWWADYPDPENFLAPLFESRVSTQRWTRYQNSELDRIINQMQQETDDDIRHLLAIEANAILHRDAPWIWLWHSQTATIVNPELHGWKPSLMFNAEKYENVWKTAG